MKVCTPNTIVSVHYVLSTMYLDPNLNLADSKQKFLSWQSTRVVAVVHDNIILYEVTPYSVGSAENSHVWLLCLLCQFSPPPSHVSAHRVSGSAVKSLFSQYKYAAGGKLDAANYATARAACLVQRAVAPAHHSGKGIETCLWIQLFRVSEEEI